MAKATSRDYPLSPTPEPVSDSTKQSVPLTRKEYKSQMKQAKWQHNIEAAQAGTLNKERTDKIKNTANAIGAVINAASSAKNLVGKNQYGNRSIPSDL